MSHLRVVPDTLPPPPIESHARRDLFIGDVGNLLAEYARLRNAPGYNWSRGSCFITAWRWRRIWRGGRPPVWRGGRAPAAAVLTAIDDDGGEAA